MHFSDRFQSITACETNSCDNCHAHGKISCGFDILDILTILPLVIPSFLLGSVGIALVNGWVFGFWAVFALFFFGFVHVRFFCAHCPHYQGPGKFLMCHASIGIYKIAPFKPGPMALWEKIILFSGYALIWGLPIIITYGSRQWFLLCVYLLCTIGFFSTVFLFFCPRCPNFACPANQVDEKTKTAFLDKNPLLKDAWEQRK